MPKPPRKIDLADGAAFARVPEKSPPGRLSRFLGAADLAGAEAAIVNLLADLGPDEITPDLVQDVCDRYGVPEAKRDHVRYTIFRSTIERYVKRDSLTQDGERLLPKLAIALGIPSPEVAKITTSVIRSKKRAREKTSTRKATAANETVPKHPASPQLVCPKCRSEHVAIGNQGYGLRKAAAGFLAWDRSVCSEA
jgi:hypothetical protein